MSINSQRIKAYFNGVVQKPSWKQLVDLHRNYIVFLSIVITNSKLVKIWPLKYNFILRNKQLLVQNTNIIYNQWPLNKNINKSVAI